jgi:Cu2+-exporting ATPase
MGQQDIQNDSRTGEPLEQGGYESLVVQDADGRNNISLLISGVHCAGCIQKIESRLAANENVKQARLNFSTHRLTIAWEGQPENANRFVKEIENLGYGVRPYDSNAENSENKAEEKFLLLSLGIAGFAMGNIMLLSIGLWITDIETMGIGTRSLMHWIAALIAIPAVMVAGRPFFRSAFKALKNGHTNMDVPISLALILATGMSLVETINKGEHVYFDSAVMLMFFLLIGRYLDFKARLQARSTATDLLSTLTGFAVIVEGNKTRRLPVRDLRENMVVRVASGEKFPVDGVIQDGKTSVDTSLVTGEVVPVDVGPGTEVFAGTMNMGRPVLINVSGAADTSLLADIVRLMEKAAQSQALYVRLADKAARLYTPVVHSLAALAFLGWLVWGGIGWQDSLMIAVTVLIITCPCALGLAVPVVQVLATNSLMKKNILVKSGDALERMAGIDTVVFDKTGTLTLGRPQLEGNYDAGTLKIAASLATYSNHPLSRALTSAYSGPLESLQDFEEISGQGLQAQYKGKRIRLGNRSWCGNGEVPDSEKLELWLDIEGENPSAFYFSDIIKKDAPDIIKNMKDKGFDIYLLSGDRQIIADQVARECGIEKTYGDMTPVEKFDFIESLKEQGHKVLMVGDGLNDAPVLAGATVSMAPGTAIDMAQNAADIIFMGDNLKPVSFMHDVSCFSHRLVKQNFALAVSYNIIAIPLALAGMVTPLIAALAMSGSSLLVIANSFRLKLKA